MYENETPGQRLKRLRKAKELTQAQLATQAGLNSQSAITMVESGKRGLGRSVIAVAKILGVPPEYLLCESETVDLVRQGAEILLTQDRLNVLSGTIKRLHSFAISTDCPQVCADEIFDRIAELEKLLRGVEREKAIIAQSLKS